jgi:hypothetical protein
MASKLIRIECTAAYAMDTFFYDNPVTVAEVSRDFGMDDTLPVMDGRGCCRTPDYVIKKDDNLCFAYVRVDDEKD